MATAPSGNPSVTLSAKARHLMLLPGAETLDLDAARAHLATHGYARLGRLLDDAGLEALGARADDIMQGRVHYPGLFFQLDAANGRYEDAPRGLGWQGPSLNYRKLEKLEKDPLFLQWIENPLFERIARAQLGGDVVLYRCIMFNKGPGGGSDTPWHQDAGKLWGLSQPPELQIWTALDDAPVDGGCLEVVPGSHLRGLASELGGVVPQDQLTAHNAEAQALALPAERGEVILVHNLVWHRARKSLAGHKSPALRRRALSVCYMSAATRCLRKKHAPRQFFELFRS